MSQPTPEDVRTAALLGMSVEDVAIKRARHELHGTRDPGVLLPAIRERLGLECKLLRVVKTDANPVSWRIETSEGVVRLPGDRWITRAADFRAAFISTVGERPATPREPEWGDLCTLISRAAEVEDVGEEATDAGLGAGWVREFLLTRSVVPDDEYEPGLPTAALRHNGTVHVLSYELRRWLREHGERPQPARLGEVLRASGCEPGRLDLLRDGKRLQMRTWLVPDELLPDDLLGDE